jgi:hypothetical protein
MSPDGVVQAAAAELAAGAQLPATSLSLGWLEVALPLWHRRWRLLLSTLLCAALGTGLCFMQPVRFTAAASFVVQPQMRASNSLVASALPSLAGLIGGGGSPTDLHLAILRSETVSDRIIDRFELQRVWGFRTRMEARVRLARRVAFGVGRRDGVVQIVVEDESAQRAAVLANEYIEELRNVLRNFSLEEARQRRLFYDAQLTKARSNLEQAQKKLQGSGFDKAALRSEPRAAADAYGRLQAEVAAAEVRLSATQRVRTEGSAEIQNQRAELAGLRAQLALLELPKGDGEGSFVGRLREFRYAEAFNESLARQAEAARVDEAADQLPVQVLDRAKTPEGISSPNLVKWVALGALLGLVLPGSWVLLRHRAALKRLDPAYLQRLDLIRSVLPSRRRSA